MSRWHLEAGIACEHAAAPSVRETDWGRVVAFYDLLAAQSPGPIVALNRALAVSERDGVEEGRRELAAVAGDKKLAGYPFYWAALADLQRRRTAPLRRDRATNTRSSCPAAGPNATRTCVASSFSPSGNGPCPVCPTPFVFVV